MYGDVPDGIRCSPNLATACVWDNNDSNTETLDGKDTFHATVGHTYQNIVPDPSETIRSGSHFREGRNRRSFTGNEREIPAFRRSLNKASFSSEHVDTDIICLATTSNNNQDRVPIKPMDLYWLWKLRDGYTPLHAGFISLYIDIVTTA